MIIKDGYEVHPLRQSRITKGSEVVFELNAPHARSWFVLDLALPKELFVPQYADGVMTADGALLYVGGRRT